MHGYSTVVRPGPRNRQLRLLFVSIRDFLTDASRHIKVIRIVIQDAQTMARSTLSPKNCTGPSS